MKLAAVLALAACGSAREPLTSCASSLAGDWNAPSGHWSVLDNGATLEAYPLFVDAPTPRVIDLRRDGSGASGFASRRYMHGAEQCVAKAPVHLTACRGDTLELVLADPAEPAFVDGTCLAGSTPPSRRERWTR